MCIRDRFYDDFAIYDCRYWQYKQKTAYEISECDWSSDVCSSDLTKNVNKNTGANTYGSNSGQVRFTASHTGYYHFRFTPVANS